MLQQAEVRARRVRRQMWPLVVAAGAAFAGTWAGAALAAALDAWIPAAALLAAAGAAWIAAAAGTAYVSRQTAWWSHTWTVAGVTAATLSSLAWFGTLFAAIQAADPAALASAAPLDGWAPYGLSIDAMRSGVGVVLPRSLAARLALAAEQVVVWPTMFLLLASMLAMLSARRRATRL